VQKSTCNFIVEITAVCRNLGFRALISRLFCTFEFRENSEVLANFPQTSASCGLVATLSELTAEI